MSIWETYDVEEEPLTEVEYRSKPEHHFDTQFVSAYQLLAIELNYRYPEIAN